jgi:hypothetical protein
MIGLDNQQTHFSRGLQNLMMLLLKRKQGQQDQDALSEQFALEQAQMPEDDVQILQEAIGAKRPLTIKEQQAIDSITLNPDQEWT